ncbi:NAD(P)-dependent alcohol dehydrogenase [Tunturiibacter empetritectus]|uniref:Aryl-alcohol dehydrogenase n=1 Tax=Tunturiibacter lichenicola TaxID=2051959 RepID=A0A852VK65_9BACT|nr:NAD(P)-dependent alcohol dehydrogenase [Edaphobacter lichenicola]NYF91551.1 aryl-alcohol dehydrogenase [Edaphobacter lichenicola]
MRKAIKAAVARAISAPLTLETLQIEDPRAGEVRVSIIASGICHTDIAMRDQVFAVPHPIVLGHEGAGVVESVGADVVHFSPGDHVVMSYSSCGRCSYCKQAETAYCNFFFELNFKGARLDGTGAFDAGPDGIHSHFFGQSSFAEYSVCAVRNLIRVPKDIPLELLAPLGCGVMTGAGSIMHALKVRVGESIAVFGAGSVGLSAVMAARVVGATQIIAVDVNDARLQMALELGATHVINPHNEEPASAIKGMLPEGVNFALDTTSRPETITAAISALSSRGSCGLVGVSPPDDRISIAPMEMVSFGKKLQGIVEGEVVPSVFIPQLIELYRQGRFPFDRLIRFYPFEEVNQAIYDSETGRAIKAVIRMEH